MLTRRAVMENMTNNSNLLKGKAPIHCSSDGMEMAENPISHTYSPNISTVSSHRSAHHCSKKKKKTIKVEKIWPEEKPDTSHFFLQSTEVVSAPL